MCQLGLKTEKFNTECTLDLVNSEKLCKFCFNFLYMKHSKKSIREKIENEMKNIIASDSTNIFFRQIYLINKKH